MELSGSNLKKFLIFSQKSFSYILGNGSPEKIPYSSRNRTSKVPKTNFFMFLQKPL